MTASMLRLSNAQRVITHIHDCGYGCYIFELHEALPDLSKQQILKILNRLQRMGCVYQSKHENTAETSSQYRWYVGDAEWQVWITYSTTSTRIKLPLQQQFVALLQKVCEHPDFADQQQTAQALLNHYQKISTANQ